MQIFYLCYAVIGIPMTMVILANAGKFFASFIAFGYTWAIRKMRRYHTLFVYK